LNFIHSWFSFSAEYKDYHAFTLGYNEPPSLVKEHTFTLLNRSTHATIPLDERGWQIETLINLFDLNTATLNFSNATNDIYGNEFSYYEVYADLNFYPNETSHIKGFIDISEDEIKSQYERITGGISYERQLRTFWNILFELQNQQYDVRFKYNPDDNYSAANRLLGITISRSPGLSGGFVLEHSTDEAEIGENSSYGFFNRKFWPGLIFNYNYKQDWDFGVFFGKRRGGNACTGGICYEVQPFEGIEIRINTLL
jgi:hypothetical protein